MKKILLASVVAAFFAVVGVVGASSDRIVVCHMTSSDKNPVVINTISTSALQTHLDHGDSIFVEGQPCAGDPLPV